MGCFLSRKAYQLWRQISNAIFVISRGRAQKQMAPLDSWGKTVQDAGATACANSALPPSCFNTRTPSSQSRGQACDALWVVLWCIVGRVVMHCGSQRMPRPARDRALQRLLLPPNRLRPSFFAIFFKRLDENPRNFRSEHLRTCPNFHYRDILLSHKYFRYFPLTRNVKVNLGPDGG